MKRVILVGLLTISSTAVAGSDSLKCSSQDGSRIIQGSLWNGSAQVFTLSREGLSKLSVTQIDPISEVDLLIGSDASRINKAMEDAKKDILRNSIEHLLITEAGPEKVLKNEERSECRDTGDKEFRQNLKLTSIYPVWNSKTEKMDTRVKAQTLLFSCHYTYATTRGGRDCTERKISKISSKQLPVVLEDSVSATVKTAAGAGK